MKNFSGRRLASARKKVTPPLSLGASIKRVERATSAIKAGQGVVVLDSQSRENEGDLIIAAAAITDEQVNFMMKSCRGLICVAMTQKKLDELAIPLMYDRSVPESTSTRTYFTVSVDHKDSTTGISAFERAQTLQALAAKTSTAADFILPGHIFPIRAASSILIRNGHTEAGIYLTTLAHLPPAAVICEIINDDGTMARQTDLVRFTTAHALEFLSIQDLILYKLFFSGLLNASQSLTIDIAINKEKASALASRLSRLNSKPNLKRTSTQSPQVPTSCTLNITVYRNSTLTEQSRNAPGPPPLMVLECGLDIESFLQPERVLHDNPNSESGLSPLHSSNVSKYNCGAISWISEPHLIANAIEICLVHYGSNRQVTAEAEISMQDNSGRYFMLGLFSNDSIATFFETLDSSLDPPLASHSTPPLKANDHSQTAKGPKSPHPNKHQNDAKDEAIKKITKKMTWDQFLAAAGQLKGVPWKDTQSYYPGDTLASLLMGIFHTRDIQSIVPIATLVGSKNKNLHASAQLQDRTAESREDSSTNRELTLQAPISLLKGLKRSGMQVQL